MVHGLWPVDQSPSVHSTVPWTDTLEIFPLRASSPPPLSRPSEPPVRAATPRLPVLPPPHPLLHRRPEPIHEDRRSPLPPLFFSTTGQVPPPSPLRPPRPPRPPPVGASKQTKPLVVLPSPLTAVLHPLRAPPQPELVAISPHGRPPHCSARPHRRPRPCCRSSLLRTVGRPSRTPPPSSASQPPSTTVPLSLFLLHGRNPQGCRSPEPHHSVLLRASARPAIHLLHTPSHGQAPPLPAVLIPSLKPRPDLGRPST